MKSVIMGFYLIWLDFSRQFCISANFYFLSAILNFYRLFWILSAVLDSVWKVSAYKWKYNPPVSNFTHLLPQTHRFRDISFSNFTIQSLSREFPPRSRQARDNRGLYCTVMEALRGGVLYMSLILGGPKFHSFLASDARFSRYCSF